MIRIAHAAKCKISWTAVDNYTGASVSSVGSHLRLIRMINWLSDVVPLGCLHLHSIQLYLNGALPPMIFSVSLCCVLWFGRFCIPAFFQITLLIQHLPKSSMWLQNYILRISIQWIQHSISILYCFHFCVMWDCPHVNLIASHWNRQIQTFVSPLPHSFALAVDAMARCWSNFIGKPSLPSHSSLKCYRR